MIAEYLTMQGFTVLQAANGLEGLLHVHRSAPRVVILDLRMPRLGGIEALKLIRRFDPTIVVIVISAGIDADIAREAIAQGARAVLAKPLDLDRLAAVLPAPDAAVSSAQVAAPSRPSPPTVSGVPASAPRAPARVLVVDDEPRVRSLLAETLGSWGYVVQQAPDGVAALQVIEADRPDVILLDVAMPGLSGPEALPAIRALAPGVNVILVSGTPDVDMRALALGAFDYIVKPVDFNYLAQSLEAALAMKRLEA